MRMSAEPTQFTSTETWAQWEGLVVNLNYPLRRLLGCSDHSAVFLTEYKTSNLANAAIKLMRIDAPQARMQLEQWKIAAALSHPHLVRVFEVGRCWLGMHEFVFAVMEYADQTLAEILQRRPLSLDEARELLPPALSALAFLHQHHLVHSQFKPSNLLAVDDQLKLASDTVHTAGHSAAVVTTSVYDALEIKSDSVRSAASDVWSFGITLVEALTQHIVQPDPFSGAIALPDNLPAAFSGMVRRCLSPNPAHRPTVAELETPFRVASRAPAPSVEIPPPGKQASREAPSPGEQQKPMEPQKRNLIWPIIGALFMSIGAWASLSYLTSQDQPPAPMTQAPTPVAPPPVVTQPVVAKPTPDAYSGTIGEMMRPAPEPLPDGVINEVIPDIPQISLDRIRNRINVSVRVLVNPEGNVVAALVDNAGSSPAFADLSEEAARDWQFTPSNEEDLRVWILRFEYRREGATVTAGAQ